MLKKRALKEREEVVTIVCEDIDDYVVFDGTTKRIRIDEINQNDR